MYNKGNFDILYKPINVLTILDQSWLFQNCQVGHDTWNWTTHNLLTMSCDSLCGFFPHSPFGAWKIPNNECWLLTQTLNVKYYVLYPQYPAFIILQNQLNVGIAYNRPIDPTGIFTYIYHKKSNKCQKTYQSHSSYGFSRLWRCSNIDSTEVQGYLAFRCSVARRSWPRLLEGSF